MQGRRESMKKNMTLEEAVFANESLGYEFVIENGEITGAHIDIYIPAEWGE